MIPRNWPILYVVCIEFYTIYIVTMTGRSIVLIYIDFYYGTYFYKYDVKCNPN